MRVWTSFILTTTYGLLTVLNVVIAAYFVLQKHRTLELLHNGSSKLVGKGRLEKLEQLERSSKQLVAASIFVLASVVLTTVSLIASILAAYVITLIMSFLNFLALQVVGIIQIISLVPRHNVTLFSLRTISQANNASTKA